MSKQQDTAESHESYAMIGISRIHSGADEPLFGSSITHSNCIRVRIKHATVDRSYNNDRFDAYGQSIIEVDLSLTQFAEFITSMNVGSGVPCTIAYQNGAQIARPPFINKREQFVNEFKKDTTKVAKKLDDLLAFAKSLEKKASVSKGDRTELTRMIAHVRQDINSDMPFVAQQFNEQMERTIHEAKGEVEGYVAQRTQELGLQNLSQLGQGMAKQITSE